MIPDWKLERFLTGDLPESEMREIRELEVTDEMLARRIEMLREDNKAILNKLPFEALAGKLADAAETANVVSTASRFRLLKLASAAVLVLSVALVALMTQRETVVAGGNVAGGDVAQARNAQNTQVALAETPSDTRIKVP